MVDSFPHRDPSYLDPPEYADEAEAERREDREWEEGDRAYDERRDREMERDDDYGDIGDGR